MLPQAHPFVFATDAHISQCNVIDEMVDTTLQVEKDLHEPLGTLLRFCQVVHRLMQAEAHVLRSHGAREINIFCLWSEARQLIQSWIRNAQGRNAATLLGQSAVELSSEET